MADLRTILEEFERREQIKANMPDVLSGAFPKQLEFILHPSKLKALFCTRRSAKSYTAGLYLVYESLRNPGCNVIFVGLTRASAKAIIWKDVLKDIARRNGLAISFNETELTATLANGSVIYVTGADADEDEMNKLLGRKFRLACIDEASMYTINLRNLVYGVLGPAMTDPNLGGQRGTICLMGTASDFPQGLFYDVTTRKEGGWYLFEWTAHDNPHVAKQWQEALDEIARERPLYMETPQFKQWYLNQWVIDEEKLVYRFNPLRNLIQGIPHLSQDGWTNILGVDLGWEDDNAFTLSRYHVNNPNLYITRFFKKKKLEFDFDQDGFFGIKDLSRKYGVVQVIQEFMKDPVAPPHKVVIDGANKQGVESMKSRTTIPFEYADKNDKATFIELYNADLVQGKILYLDTPEMRPLWQEKMALVWVTEGDKIKYPKKEHPSLPNHGCDSSLYGWRMGYHYHASPPAKKIIHGSREWYLQQNENIWEREKEKLEAENQQDLWPEQPEFSLSDVLQRYR